jgi:ATP-dependent Lon protease
MKESVGTALSWIRTNAAKLGIIPKETDVDLKVVKADEERAKIQNFFSRFDIHVHFPAAAVPKDGPSAGVTITVALVSLFTGRRVKSDFAMTGEVSLQGLVMPVGGIKEKCMAAHRNKIKNVILPKLNEKDISSIPADLKKDIKIHFASNVVEAIILALENKQDKEYLNQ